MSTLAPGGVLEIVNVSASARDGKSGDSSAASDAQIQRRLDGCIGALRGNLRSLRSHHLTLLSTWHRRDARLIAPSAGKGTRKLPKGRRRIFALRQNSATLFLARPSNKVRRKARAIWDSRPPTHRITAGLLSCPRGIQIKRRHSIYAPTRESLPNGPGGSRNVDGARLGRHKINRPRRGPQ